MVISRVDEKQIGIGVFRADFTTSGRGRISLEVVPE
jgi:hypothetical protein